MARKKKLIPHYDFPKRKIVRTERHDGRSFVVMVCKHAMEGKPASRMSRFYPCRTCYDIVEAHRRAHRRGRHGKP